MKPELALELIDQAQSWGLADRILLADAGYGDVTDFRDALQTRQLPYAVGIGPQMGVWPKPPTITRRPYSGKGRPATRCVYGTQRPPSMRDVALHARGWKTIRWREGTKGWLVSRFLSVRVLPSHGYHEGEPPHKEVWLLIEWPPEAQEPTTYFVCNLPPTYTVRRLVRLTKCRWAIEQDDHQLKEELGLDHYEGRTWAGWHHHVTLTMLAHAFLTLEALRTKNNFWADPASDAP